MAVVVTLNPEENAEAKALARVLYAAYKDYNGPYPGNLESQFVGVQGETAVEKWLREMGQEPDSAFRDPRRSGEADILIGPCRRLEIKTWSLGFFDRLGRCICCEQENSLRRKADAVVWATVQREVVDMRWFRPHVTLVGWNTVEEVLAIPVTFVGYLPKGGRNHQVPHDQLRPMEELLRWPGW